MANAAFARHLSASSLPDDCDIQAFAAVDAPQLEICVPMYRYDTVPLIRALSAMPDAARCGLTIYDDGSGQEALLDGAAEALEDFPGAGRLVTARENAGRAEARNRLVLIARSDWLLLLDADMMPDHDGFLSDYLAAIGRNEAPRLVAGGFSLEQAVPGRDTALHVAQSLKSECVPSTVRKTEPGRYVFTSNILVHRDVMTGIAFDDAFSGWGWEDVDWGLRVADAFPVEHIDNCATHLGLDSDEALMAKYERSGENFARLVVRHPQAARQMSLYRAARTLRFMPARRTVARLARRIAASSKGTMPMPVRLFALKLYRAAIYADALG